MEIIDRIGQVRDELVHALSAAAGAQKADAMALAMSERKVAALTAENAKLQEVIFQLKSELERRGDSPRMKKSGRQSPPKSPSPWTDDPRDKQQLFAILEARRKAQ